MGKIKLSELKVNPKNPRLIKDLSFEKLKKSIAEFPKMLELRPIIIDDENMILGGNMRYKALKDLKYKEITDVWVKKASELTEEEKTRFILTDNIEFGEWDYDLLKDNFEDTFDLIDFEEKDIIKKTTVNIDPYEKTHILLSYPISYHSVVNKLIESLIEYPEIEIERSSN